MNKPQKGEIYVSRVGKELIDKLEIEDGWTFKGLDECGNIIMERNGFTRSFRQIKE